MKKWIFALLILMAVAPTGGPQRVQSVTTLCPSVARPASGEMQLVKIANDANNFCLSVGTGLNANRNADGSYTLSLSQNVVGHPADDFATTEAGECYDLVTGAALYRQAANNVMVEYTLPNGQSTQLFDCPFHPPFNRATGRGSKIDEVHVLYRITTGTLGAYTATLAARCFTNGATVTTTSVPFTGTLQTAPAVGTYDTVLTVTTPAYENTPDCEYNIELSTAYGSQALTFDFYGVIWYYKEN